MWALPAVAEKSARTNGENFERAGAGHRTQGLVRCYHRKPCRSETKGERLPFPFSEFALSQPWQVRPPYVCSSFASGDRPTHHAQAIRGSEVRGEIVPGNRRAKVALRASTSEVVILGTVEFLRRVKVEGRISMSNPGLTEVSLFWPLPPVATDTASTRSRSMPPGRPRMPKPNGLDW